MSKPKLLPANSILIVDDETEVCILLENFLIRKNQKVAYSTSLKDGIEKFKLIKPDLLILDHNMPDGNGIENIPAFKTLNSSLKIIIISAMSNLKDEALQKGADYFLEKPISFSMLKNIITN
jgi:DNA-binding response OmpR family regulator